MKIYAIRHGETELNKKGIINGNLDDALAPEGIEQARAAKLLMPQTVKRIYSSSLARAKQTAIILNEELQLELTFHDELKEVNFGDLNGTPYLDEIKEHHKRLDYDWRPSGECVADVKKRIFKILPRIATENADGEALIVAHGGIIRMLHFLEFGEFMDRVPNASFHSFNTDKIL